MTTCPKCKAAMYERSIDGVPVDVCSGCRALWIDRTALDFILQKRVSGRSLVKAEDLMSPAAAESTNLPCPRCARNLLLYRHEQVEVEWCCGCRGIYLDFGELDSILAWKRARVRQDRKDAACAGALGVLGYLADAVTDSTLFR